MAAAALGIALWLIEGAGYVPSGDQTREVRASLSILFGLVPALMHGVAMLVVWRYPITRTRHAEPLERIRGAAG